MKQFDEWYETRNKVSNEYVSEDETGINLARRAFRAGMLAAADIVTDSARGFRLDREGVANKIREAAK